MSFYIGLILEATRSISTSIVTASGSAFLQYPFVLHGKRKLTCRNQARFICIIHESQSLSPKDCISDSHGQSHPAGSKIVDPIPTETSDDAPGEVQRQTSLAGRDLRRTVQQQAWLPTDEEMAIRSVQIGR